MDKRVVFLTGTGISAPGELSSRGGLHAKFMAESLCEPNGFEAALRFHEVQVERLKRVNAELGPKLKDDEAALTAMADFIRSANAHLAALKGNIEAFKLSHQMDQTFAQWAGVSMGFLYTMLQAIETEHCLGIRKEAA